MKTVLFVNFSDEAFTGYWDSQAYEFAPGQTMYLEDWKARHFAKHLVNRELLKLPDGEKHQSPKEKDGRIDDKVFMELFNKAVISQDGEDLPESKAASEVLNLNAEEKKAKKAGAKKVKPADSEQEFADLEK